MRDFVKGSASPEEMNVSPGIFHTFQDETPNWKAHNDLLSE